MVRSQTCTLNRDVIHHILKSMPRMNMVTQKRKLFFTGDHNARKPLLIINKIFIILLNGVCKLCGYQMTDMLALLNQLAHLRTGYGIEGRIYYGDTGGQVVMAEHTSLTGIYDDIILTDDIIATIPFVKVCPVVGTYY